MFNKFIAISLLCGVAFAGTWRVDGVKTSEALLLDQTLPQTIANGPVDVMGLINQYAVNDVGYIFANATYAQVFELYGVSDSGSYVDTSAGSFQDQTFTIEINPYGVAPDSTLVYTSGTYFQLSNLTSTPFQLQLTWSDSGDSLNFSSRGFYVLINDGTSYYWKDVGNVTSLQVSDFTGWEQGTPNSSFNSPYTLPAGSLYSQNYWSVYAKNASGLKTVYSSNYSGADDSGDQYGWSMALSWDAVEGATSYIVYNSTAGYWIETTDTSIVDNGDHSYWNYGAPDVSPSSPVIENKDFLGGHNTDVSVKLNGYGQFETTAGTGISPLKVNSPTLNENLNADLLDGQHAYEFQPAGSYQAAGVCITNVSASGRITASNLNQNVSLFFAETNAVYAPNATTSLSVSNNGTLVLNVDERFMPNETMVTNATTGNPVYFLYATNNLMFAARETDFKLVYSTDYGTNWTLVGGAIAPVVSFFNGDAFTYIGTNYCSARWSTGVLARSPTGTNSWTTNYIGGTISDYGKMTKANNKLFFHDQFKSWVSGDYGSTWIKCTNSSGETFGYWVAHISDQTYIACGGGGTASWCNISTNGGLLWSTLNSPYSDINLLVNTGDKLIALVNDGTFMYSTNGFDNLVAAAVYGDFPIANLSNSTNIRFTKGEDGKTMFVWMAESNGYGSAISYDGGLSWRGIYTNTPTYVQWEPCKVGGNTWNFIESTTHILYRWNLVNKSTTVIPTISLQGGYGVTVTNSWVDSSSVTNTQIFNKGVLTLWTKNGI